VVLCSDGVWSAVADEELAAIVSDAQDLRAACSRLLALANDRGGRDNATVLLARLETVTE
ncbi:MAG: protein phosphatase, partial [Candidatus Rokuibacteriota bacterium]